MQRSLARDVKARFQSCQEMRAAIQALEGALVEDDLSLYVADHTEVRADRTTSRPLKPNSAVRCALTARSRRDGHAPRSA